MPIPDTVIEEVRRSVDLVDVVGDYVRLKRRGGRFFGLCPFHNEKSPSFSVDPNENLYYCFGCRRGGDLFKFVQEVEGMEFLETVRLLAERAGIEIPESEGQSEAASEREALHGVLRFAAKFYYDQLRTDVGKPGLDYFIQRGFSKKTITGFGLGFAPTSWDALVTAAQAAHYDPALLVKADLARAGSRGVYDRFRGRAMFPIISHVGKVLGFGGRVIPGVTPPFKDGDPPKYLNSSETPVYHKSSVLYGLRQAKQAIRAEGEALLVEGYTDVISLHQAGVAHVVASSGTALTAEQIRLAGRYAQALVLLYDADSAGLDAALRAIDLVLGEGLGVYAVALPDGADPDAFVQQFGTDAFRTVLRDDRMDFVAFRVAVAKRRGELDTPEGQSRVVHSLMASVAKIPDPIVQEGYVQRAAQLLRVPDATLRPLFRAALAEAGRERTRASRRDEARREEARPRHDGAAGSPQEPWAHRTPDATLRRPPPRPTASPAELLLVKLMLEHGMPMVEHVLTRMALTEFSEGGTKTAVEKLIEQAQQDRIEATPFKDGTYGPAVQQAVAEALVERHAVSDNWSRVGIEVRDPHRDPFAAATSAMQVLKLLRLDQAIADVQRRIYAADQAGEDLRPLQELMLRYQHMKRDVQTGAFLDWGTGNDTRSDAQNDAQAA
ncbi:MAG: DNA primase [Bacteroidota bacterium]